jgi:hypothetical protein
MTIKHEKQRTSNLKTLFITRTVPTLIHPFPDDTCLIASQAPKQEGLYLAAPSSKRAT